MNLFKRIIICFIIVSFYNNANAQLGQTNKDYLELIKDYEQLSKTIKSEVSPQKKYALTIFKGVLESYLYPDSVLVLFADYLMDSSSVSKSELQKEWQNYNYRVILQLQKKKNFPIPVLKFDTTRLMNHSRIKQDTFFMKFYTLEYTEEFDSAIKHITKIHTDSLFQNSVIYHAEIKRVKKLYENKWYNGYRNRNIVEYFAEGWLLRNTNKEKMEKQGLLAPPSQYALILLSNPYVGVASNSLDGFKTNTTNLYTILPLVGIDWFYRKGSFKHFIGSSIFNAFPLNANDPFINGSMIGLELHFDNKINLGYGVSYNELKGEPNNMVTNKIFISVALFNKYFKK